MKARVGFVSDAVELEATGSSVITAAAGAALEVGVPVFSFSLQLQEKNKNSTVIINLLQKIRREKNHVHNYIK